MTTIDPLTQRPCLAFLPGGVQCRAVATSVCKNVDGLAWWACDEHAKLGPIDDGSGNVVATVTPIDDWFLSAGLLPPSERKPS